MKESVGFDLEHQPASTISPACPSHPTAMIVVRGRGAANGKAPKAMLTLDAGGSDIQSAPIQGLPERQLVPTTKRGVSFVIRADVVAVPPAHRTVARMELASHLGRRRNPNVRR
jgi:hypothetical protein